MLGCVVNKLDAENKAFPPFNRTPVIDVHTKRAAAMFHVSYWAVTPEQRKKAKQAGYAQHYNPAK